MPLPNDSRGVPATAAVILLFIAVAGSMSRPALRPVAAPAPAKDDAVRTQMLIEVAKGLLGGIENGVIFYSLEQGGFPDGNGTEVLHRLANPVKDEFGYLEPDWLGGHTDPWGNAFNYRWPHPHVKNAKKPAIWSNGPNGINENGGGDDVRNW